MTEPTPPPVFFAPWSEEKFAVFTYVEHPGWWRLLSQFKDLEVAQRVANDISRDGTPVFVTRQVVRHEARQIVSAPHNSPQHSQRQDKP